MARQVTRDWVRARAECPECVNLIWATCEHKPAGKLLDWLFSVMRHSEELCITCWHDQLFYVWIRDKASDVEHPGNVSIGFTISAKTGNIMWNVNNPLLRKPHGNCFCRSKRWRALVCKRYENLRIAPSCMHWYGIQEPRRRPCGSE